MDDFNIDLSQVEDTGSQDVYEPLPEGVYELQAETWERKTSKAGNQYIKVMYRVLGPTFANRVVWENFTYTGGGALFALSMLKNWIKSTGGNPDVPLNQDTMDGLMLRSFSGKVAIEHSTETDPSTGEPKYTNNRIKTFIGPAKKSVPQASVASPKQSVPTATGIAIDNWD